MAILRLNHCLLRKVLASQFCDNPLSSIALSLYSTRNSASCSFSTIKNFNNGLGKRDSRFKPEESNFAASVNVNVEHEDDDDEEEGISDDEGLEFIGSSHGNKKQRENVGRVEIDESEFRHPLVKGVCRLITLRSTWNPKFEGNLRHLLRSLKPPLVCTVLRSQVDERIALSFFYWADWHGESPGGS